MMAASAKIPAAQSSNFLLWKISGATSSRGLQKIGDGGITCCENNTDEPEAGRDSAQGGDAAVMEIIVHGESDDADENVGGVVHLSPGLLSEVGGYKGGSAGGECFERTLIGAAFIGAWARPVLYYREELVTEPGHSNCPVNSRRQ